MAETRRFHLYHQTLLTSELQGVSLQAGVSRGVTQTWQGSVTAYTSRRGGEARCAADPLSAMFQREECCADDTTVLTKVSSMVW